jgi:acyl-coenzyme A thioesterase PaaI-like protein
MPDGSVTAEFTAAPFLEGYVGRLHGGVIAALLDGAMTNCLFALGYQAFTAELTIRYRHPVAVTQPLLVRAWRTDSRGPLHLLRAELRQNGKLSVTAIGKFMQFDE